MAINRNRNLIPDMRETRHKTQTFANPYAPAAPKQTAFRTPKMSSTAMPNTMYDDEAAKLRTPFKGDDPFSKTARTMWDLPGTISQGFSNVFTGKTKISDEQWAELAANVALTGMAAAAGIAAGRSTFRARASTRSLAAARIRQAGEIAANREAARLQFRDIVDQRRAARRNRQSTTARALLLERIEASLRDSHPELAQRFGDRAYALHAGRTIAGEMATSPTVGQGRRTAPSVGFGPRSVGARSFPYSDDPAAGSHHQYTPLDRSVPASVAAHEWMRLTGRGVPELSLMYPGGVPKGGWMRRPNLRTRTPLPSRWTPDLKEPVINVGEMADGPKRDRVAALLSDADAFRNRSAWRLQQDPKNRTVFPKAFDWIHEPSWAPEAYQVRVIRSRQRLSLGTPRTTRRIGK